jgi:hypothetical protein
VSLLKLLGYYFEAFSEKLSQPVATGNAKVESRACRSPGLFQWRSFGLAALDAVQLLRLLLLRPKKPCAGREKFLTFAGPRELL